MPGRLYEVARKSWLTWVEVELLDFTEHADCRLPAGQQSMQGFGALLLQRRVRYSPISMFYVMFSYILILSCDKLHKLLEFQCVGLVAAAACVALWELH